MLEKRSDETIKSLYILSSLNTNYLLTNETMQKILKMELFHALHRLSKKELAQYCKLAYKIREQYDKLYQDRLHPEALNRVIDSIHHLGVNVLLQDDLNYPSSLKIVDTPPSILWVLGDRYKEVLKMPKMTIIGTRQPTAYGIKLAQDVSTYLASHGICVVSGMALGIDGIAHRAAMDCGGYTIAVLGSGIDVIYPKRHQLIYQKIQERGMILSEYPPGTKAMPRHFPVRNRLLAGLGDVTIVIESTLRSGTLITCDFALDYGKDVLAVPGSIYSEQSKGTNKLIREGASPLLSREDLEDYIQRSHFKASIEG